MITLAKPADASEIHRVMIAAFEEYRNTAVPSSALDETIDSIRSFLEEGKERALLFWINNIALGTVRFKEKDGALYFFRLSVRPEWRGRGVARHLLSALENYAATQSLGTLYCQVRLSEERNIDLYKKNGFCINDSKTIIKSNGIRVETVMMTKKL
ncbi:GNAT family N-acetyltransferase [Terribacillus saccharophilus]|uniref:GNAT family N-acetyltransferase n=1 Tax=Terribacillus saccharophilus TaxID=361277 RepID=UPI0037F3CF3D